MTTKYAITDAHTHEDSRVLLSPVAGPNVTAEIYRGDAAISTSCAAARRHAQKRPRMGALRWEWFNRPLEE
jgi:N-acyl-D-aspartate/D-glutamate deacylase